VEHDIFRYDKQAQRWTMDLMLGEDHAQPCQASKASIETVNWLRIIGYNAVSAWRQASDGEISIGRVGGDRQVALADVQVDRLRADRHYRFAMATEGLERVEVRGA
jgi:hypothetical protein